jgi:sulfate adenylyltransferase subunit 1
MLWYKGTPLLEYLETVDISSDDNEQGFYMPVQRVCRPDHTFRGFQGQIEAGSISIGDEITTLPSNEKAHVKGILVTDRNVQTAEKGQPVTISLDKEVDVSRGCVLVKDTNIAVYKKLIVSLLWMDDKSLSAGNDYLVKLGTKTISGIVSKIDYAVDVNSGKHIKTETLSKNEIAVCEILLAEAVPADLFSEHKTLGEIILIDRISNMTSACGIIEELDSKSGSFSGKASFKSGNLEARGDIFEEFYYDQSALSVLKYRSVNNTYTIGDDIPVIGASYSYPESFDIIVLRDKIAVKIRNKKIVDIIPYDEYKYDNLPVINGRGFEVMVNSQEDVSKFINEYNTTDNTEKSKFFAKWVRFDTYRKVIFKV